MQELADPLLEVHHPFDARWEVVLEPLFLRIRELLLERGEVSVPGVATFVRIEGPDGTFEAESRAADSLVWKPTRRYSTTSRLRAGFRTFPRKSPVAPGQAAPATVTW